MKGHSLRVFSRWSNVAVLAVTAGFFSLPIPCHADSYQIVHLLSGSEALSVLRVNGITASGAVILRKNPGACPNQSPCFITLVNGRQVGPVSLIDPGNYDNGTPCAPNISLGVPAFGICNNGYEVDETGWDPSHGLSAQIFTGPDPVADYFGLGTVNLLNSSGDFVYEVGGFKVGQPFDDYEAIDLTSDVQPAASRYRTVGRIRHKAPPLVLSGKVTSRGTVRIPIMRLTVRIFEPRLEPLRSTLRDFHSHFIEPG